MSNLLKTYKKIFGRRVNPLPVAIIVGCLLPLVSWIAEIIIKKIPVTPAHIVQMHKDSPVLIIMDIVPFLLILFAWVLQMQNKVYVEDFEEKLSDRDKRMHDLAEFAKQIGEGNFNFNFDVTENNDTLSQSLLAMRENLLLNHKKDTEQSWIAGGKDIISDILRTHSKIDELSNEVIHSLVKYINLVQGALYIFDEEKNILRNVATYAYNRKKYVNQEFRIGYGLIGECAYEKDYIYRTEIPDDYATITSGILGEQKPKSILLVPLITDEKLQGVMEFASTEAEIPELTIRFLKELGEIIARTLFNLKVNNQTEQLLKESQKMTAELQANEEQLRQNAEEMRATQEELQKSNEQLEANIQKVENAQKRLHSLLENASEIISIYDENMNLMYESPSVIKILGFSPEEMMGGKDMDRLTRKGENAMRSMFKQLLANPNEPVSFQYTYMKKNGQKIFLETTGRNLLKDSAIKGIILNSTDITEKKRAEKEERMRSKMQALSENSLDMIMRLSTVGQFFYANPMVESYTGIDQKDLINKTLNEVNFDESLFNYFRESIEQIKANPTKTNAEVTITATIDGTEEERIMSFVAIPEFNENELETILFVGHDITEAKRIELEIQDKNRKIEDSINYAQRIQTSILPDNRVIQEFLPKSFIFYRPRDVVSGDFPWYFKKGNDIYIAAVDCTGHGVPGALLSFIGYFLLNNIVDHESEHSASNILDNLHYNVRKTLKQEDNEAEARDGMDIAFCKINHDKKELQYAGAHRPLYYLSTNGELEEYKGDRKAIGGIPHKKKAENDFTNYVINFKRGDKVFFFSDGLPDQLGGPEVKKYSPKHIRDLIVENKDLTMEEFNALFAKDFEEWKGDNKQIDDVLLIGIEF